MVIFNVTQYFTSKDGEFVFGPLCPNKVYEIQIWVNRVKHVKVCAKCEHDGCCLKGEELDCCDKHCEKECKKEWHRGEDITVDVIEERPISE